jgi:DNA polymerase (family 10)
VQVDLLFAPPEEFGSALAYFTGSKEHNVSLRALAQSRGMKINEHGFWTLTGQRLGGENEEELYQLLDLPFVPPELREGSDLQDEIPNLISRDDLTADWHMHTFWSSDAKDSFESMAQSAKNRGLKEIGISDHTERQYGWDPTRNSIRREEAQLASQKIGIPIWVGCETGINMDGSLDWSEDYLNEMDYVIASIHKSHQHNVTERLISAAKYPKVKIIGHPTGRILGKREIPDVDWGRVFQTCAEEGVAVEINGARMDLPDNFVRQARSLGCKFIINSDAHAQDQLEWQDYGLDIARRAGLSKQDLMTPKLK